MAIRIINRSQQAYGAFNGGQIIENKPIGFPREGGFVRPYSNLFYWARAEAVIDSTIGQHPHKGFEIMSFVLEGNIRHFDTQQNEWRPLEAGDVQIIRAGNGIEHAEHMAKGAVMFQIWTDPDLSKTLNQPASYNDYKASAFPVNRSESGEVTTLIGADSPLSLDTSPLEVRRMSLSGEMPIVLEEQQVLSLYVISGSGTINGETIEQDDFIIAYGEKGVSIAPHETIDVFVITGPAETAYPTYAQRMMGSAN